MNPDASSSAYHPGREIARGGMGAVINTRDQKLGRSVAMKVMLRARASDEDRQRFLQEARVLGQLAHPNIVPVHDLGTDALGRHFYTMKLVQGVTLHDIIGKLKAADPETQAKYPLTQLLTIFQKVCDAVSFAHSRGVIHRDLKPQNIMVGEFGEVLVMDWGLAKILPGSAAALAAEAVVNPTGPSTAGGTLIVVPESAGPDGNASGDATLVAPPPSTPLAADAGDKLPGPPSSTQLTMEGTILGTPQYMSPEQAAGQSADLDARSDVFSLGGILYALLTLRPPVEGATVEEVMTKVIRADIMRPSGYNDASSRPAPPRTAAGVQPIPEPAIPMTHLPDGLVPEALSAVTMKALQARRDARYQSVAELSRDIEAYQGGFATSAEHAGTVRLIRLFIERNKMFTAAAAVIVLLTMGFMAKVISSERKATQNAQQAELNALAAKASELVAKTNETKALAAEKEALAEKEATRRALARAQTALADAAIREHDGAGARAALRIVPEDLRDVNWGYLLSRSDPSLATLRSINTGVIRGVAAHPRKPGVFAIAGADDWIVLVEAATGTRLLEFRSGIASRGSAYLLAFSPDGEELAVGSFATNRVFFRSTRDGRRLREWETPAPFAIEFSPVGKQLLITPPDRAGRGELRLHDAETGAVTWAFNARSTWVRAAFVPTGKSVVVASGAFNARLLDASDGHEVLALPDTGPFVHHLAVSPDGALAAFGDEQGGILCARLKDGQRTVNFRAAECAIRQIAFTSDSRRIVTLTYPDNRSYNHVRVWDAANGYALQAVLGADATPMWIRAHPVSGELVVVGDQAKSWDLSQLQPGWSLPSSVNAPWVAFFGDDATLLYHSAFGTPTVMRLAASGATSALWNSDGSTQRPAASLSADGRFALAGSRIGTGEFHLVQRDGNTVKEAARWKVASSTPRLVRLSADGGQVWTGQSILDPATGKELVRLTNLPGNLIDGDWVRSNRLVMAFDQGDRSTLALVDAVSGQSLCTATNDSRIFTLAVAPGGRVIAEAGQGKLVRLRDPETLEVKREFRAHDSGITALAFHPREPILATTSDDLTIRIWNIETGVLLEELRGMPVAPFSLAWGPGGRRLASAGIDRFARVWEPRSLNSRATAPSAGATGEWQSILAQLKPEEVEANGQGWTLDNGALRSPTRPYATLPLPGEFANTSYQFQIKLRRLKAEESLTVFLPVAGRQTGFILDGYPQSGFVSGLHYVDGEGGSKQPNAVLGLQINDSDAHQLDLVVLVGPVTASVEVKLDERPLFRWSGLPTALSMNGRFTGLAPGQFGLGSHRAEWVIQGVRVKRL